MNGNPQANPSRSTRPTLFAQFIMAVRVNGRNHRRRNQRFRDVSLALLAVYRETSQPGPKY
jgi:hypothetical protein